ncbi:hypothetical protein HMPREF3034_01363 [Prevotella sp. DNF00663]|uniref:hypothetical protein n=1 Tax=Prevotella sp. DNF00663 TaxID=1384078 RepID=UPI00078249ED|nr:hypothetical protein [Prevotella sp. DNF00663]KXB83125.1 hypothetical protein HMPREF3034_01363 [Prevotella sp. DNF00663]
MKLRFFVMLLAGVFFTSHVYASKKNSNQVYMYGVAASFNDSTVYFTDIQQLSSAWIDHEGFLYSRDNYSYQLKDYLAKLGFSHATCITTYSDNRKDIEKKYLKTKKKYTTVKGKGKDKNHYTVKYITSSGFAYKPIVPDEQEIEKANKKANKKKARKQKQGE